MARRKRLKQVRAPVTSCAGPSGSSSAKVSERGSPGKSLAWLSQQRCRATTNGMSLRESIDSRSLIRLLAPKRGAELSQQHAKRRVVSARDEHAEGDFYDGALAQPM